MEAALTQSCKYSFELKNLFSIAIKCCSTNEDQKMCLFGNDVKLPVIYMIMTETIDHYVPLLTRYDDYYEKRKTYEKQQIINY